MKMACDLHTEDCIVLIEAKQLHSNALGRCYPVVKIANFTWFPSRNQMVQLQQEIGDYFEANPLPKFTPSIEQLRDACDRSSKVAAFKPNPLTIVWMENNECERFATVEKAWDELFRRDPDMVPF